ncbi:MAG: (d)CMP kinase [Muribaculaceae bacterium]|nr:(d)CMP kinase [Muribaculaceae bacterium]
MKKIIIAIDGYSSSGKSTMARDLARRIGYVYVDSGAMYRAVTLYALRNGMTSAGNVDKEALVRALPDISVSFMAAGEDGVQHTLLNGEDVEKEIRSMEVSGMVSPVAVIPEVRHHLVALQRKFGEERGIVMDGRDIGTTVFPDAEMKVFVDATPEVRAERRVKELLEKGEEVDYDTVLKNIRERDYIDTHREESPLTKASDAVVLDNDNMTIPQQMDWLLDLYRERVK